MQCNQSCWNGVTNGPFSSPYNNPFHSTQSMYPDIVGEGQVTSLTLPDGTTQFFFMPTLKWWTPNATQCHPHPAIPNPMFANTNYSIPPPCNNNVGTWFIRSISNQCPQSVCNPPNPRNEPSRLAINTDCNSNFNNHDYGNGYQVRFHNDAWTSTTDLAYFYPSLRQRDFVCKPPCKDKTVQIDTEPAANNTECHYEVVCSKPCICCVGAKPMSVDSLVDPKVSTNSSNSTDDSRCSKKHNKQGNDKKRKRKNIICACDSTANIATVDKSMTTYADEGSGCTPAAGRETQTCRSEETKAVDTQPVYKSLLKSKWIGKLCRSGSSTTNERLSDGINDKRPSKRNKDGKCKQRKPKKCECRCASSATSVSSVSEDETVRSKALNPPDKGRETPYTCSTCTSMTTLKNAKCCGKKIAQKTICGKNNVPLQWLKSCQQCEVKKEETRKPSVCSSSDRVTDRMSENLRDCCSSNDCDTVANSCGR